MGKVNENYLKLPGSYLFSRIGKKIRDYEAANPARSVIRLGIGDVTQPLAPAIIKAMHEAVDEMGRARLRTGFRVRFSEGRDREEGLPGSGLPY